VVTGASSGIGEAFARQLAAKDIQLVLIARRDDRLRTLADELRDRHSVNTRTVPVDLATDDFLPVIAEATHDLDIGLLVNNAGVLRAAGRSSTAAVGALRSHRPRRSQSRHFSGHLRLTAFAARHRWIGDFPVHHWRISAGT
jgi:NADP-dependent 3-hydroxy acid dehydrogenase YdfG